MHNVHPRCQCDKYRFSLVRIIHRGHRRDIFDLFKLPPTSHKQGSNERGQSRAALTGGAGGRDRRVGANWWKGGQQDGQVAGH